MKNWKKAIALVASAAALVSVAACGPSNAGGSSDSGKKTVGFVAVGPEGGFRTANEKDIQKAFEDAGFDLTTLRPRTTISRSRFRRSTSSLTTKSTPSSCPPPRIPVGMTP